MLCLAHPLSLYHLCGASKYSAQNHISNNLNMCSRRQFKNLYWQLTILFLYLLYSKNFSFCCTMFKERTHNICTQRIIWQGCVELSEHPQFHIWCRNLLLPVVLEEVYFMTLKVSHSENWEHSLHRAQCSSLVWDMNHVFHYNTLLF